ncbi:MAG TPA: hypothetical protein VFO61_05550 [Alphaproteobacteria bacterium]|nr:hypothetical protein [Alphaproteobacteria bacterium]
MPMPLISMGRWRRVFPFAAVLLVAAFASIARAAVSKPPLVPEATIPLDHVSGRIDHMAFDPGRKRLIVAELGNDTVDVIDVVARKVVHRIAGLKEPQGTAYVKAGDAIAAANAGDGTVRLFHATDFSPAGTVAVGDDADDLRVDPVDGTLVAGYGDGGIAWIDTTRAAKLFAIPLPAHPEAFALHPTNGRVFVNVPDARRIAVLDKSTRREIAAWSIGARGSNFPMAVGPGGRAVYSVFRSPPHLVQFDSGSGAIAAEAETCGDADDVFVDAKRGRLYVSCGAGSVDVFEQTAAGLRRLGRIETTSGARTSLFVPELDRLYVAQRAGLIGGGATILVLRPEN